MSRCGPSIAASNALEGDREIWIAAGMDDYIAKPFSRDQLFAALSRWLPRTDAAPVGTSTGQFVQQALARPSVADEPINRRALDAIRALMGPSGDALAKKVIRTYLDDMPVGVARMKAAAGAGDAEELRRTAHSMKSSSANVGAERLSRLCKALETIGGKGTVDSTLPLLEEASAELERVVAALNSELVADPPRELG